jgi:hypothetical protein
MRSLCCLSLYSLARMPVSISLSLMKAGKVEPEETAVIINSYDLLRKAWKRNSAHRKRASKTAIDRQRIGNYTLDLSASYMLQLTAIHGLSVRQLSSAQWFFVPSPASIMSIFCVLSRLRQ